MRGTKKTDMQKKKISDRCNSYRGIHWNTFWNCGTQREYTSHSKGTNWHHKQDPTKWKDINRWKVKRWKNT